MREILFRGKHIHVLPQNEHLSGEWVYGYLGGKNYIYSEELESDFLIDGDTACQYSGLTDKDGKKIFEGDIMTFSAYGQDYKGDVRFINGSFAIWCGNAAPFLDHALEKHNAIIVGNIFDNPELLKTED